MVEKVCESSGPPTFSSNAVVMAMSTTQVHMYKTADDCKLSIVGSNLVTFVRTQ